MDLPIDFKELLAEFEREGVEAVLVGGYAVAFHGRPRSTTSIGRRTGRARGPTLVGPEAIEQERLSR